MPKYKKNTARYALSKEINEDEFNELLGEWITYAMAEVVLARAMDVVENYKRPIYQYFTSGQNVAAKFKRNDECPRTFYLSLDSGELKIYIHLGRKKSDGTEGKYNEGASKKVKLACIFIFKVTLVLGREYFKFDLKQYNKCVRYSNRKKDVVSHKQWYDRCEKEWRRCHLLGIPTPIIGKGKHEEKRWFYGELRQSLSDFLEPEEGVSNTIEKSTDAGEIAWALHYWFLHVFSHGMVHWDWRAENCLIKTKSVNDNGASAEASVGAEFQGRAVPIDFDATKSVLSSVPCPYSDPSCCDFTQILDLLVGNEPYFKDICFDQYPRFCTIFESAQGMLEHCRDDFKKLWNVCVEIVKYYHDARRVRKPEEALKVGISERLREILGCDLPDDVIKSVAVTVEVRIGYEDLTMAGYFLVLLCGHVRKHYINNKGVMNQDSPLVSQALSFMHQQGVYFPQESSAKEASESRYGLRALHSLASSLYQHGCVLKSLITCIEQQAPDGERVPIAGLTYDDLKAIRDICLIANPMVRLARFIQHVNKNKKSYSNNVIKMCNKIKESMPGIGYRNAATSGSSRSSNSYAAGDLPRDPPDIGDGNNELSAVRRRRVPSSSFFLPGSSSPAPVREYGFLSFLCGRCC